MKTCILAFSLSCLAFSQDVNIVPRPPWKQIAALKITRHDSRNGILSHSIKENLLGSDRQPRFRYSE